MKKLYVEIEFEDGEKNIISRVSNALDGFDISHISWSPVTKPSIAYRSASTIKENLGGS